MVLGAAGRGEHPRLPIAGLPVLGSAIAGVLTTQYYDEQVDYPTACRTKGDPEASKTAVPYRHRRFVIRAIWIGDGRIPPGDGARRGKGTVPVHPSPLTSRLPENRTCP